MFDMEMRRFDNIKYTIQKIEGTIETLIFTLVFYFTWRVSYTADSFPPYYGRGKYVLMGIYFLLLTILLVFDEGFKFGHLKLLDVITSQCICLLIVNVITYFQLSLIANQMIRVLPMIALTVVDFLIAIVLVYVYTSVYHRYYVPRRMLLVYENEQAVVLKKKMEERHDQYRITTMVSVDEGLEAIYDMIGDYDAVIISDISAEKRNDILKYCYGHDKRAYVTPKISDVVLSGADPIHLFDTPLALVRARGLNFEQRFVKRFFDILLCGIACIILSPFMLAIAVAIKLEDHGPVFYKQRRVTRYNKEFDILKFRSMIVDAEKEGAKPAVDGDPRITKVGKFIRATRMDELPQLINILMGDMSIVGPRPERVEHEKKYTEEMPEFAFRHKVKGGLTGYAQIFGKYNTTPYDKLKLDLMYIENYSLALDFKLILMTISILLKKESTEGFDKVLTVEQILSESNSEKDEITNNE